MQASRARLEALRLNLEKHHGTSGLSTEDRYRMAYLDWRIGQLLPDGTKKEKRRLLKRAQHQLELLLEIDPGHAEAHALRGSVIGEQITGMWSGMRLGRIPNPESRIRKKNTGDRIQNTEEFRSQNSAPRV